MKRVLGCVDTDGDLKAFLRRHRDLFGSAAVCLLKLGQRTRNNRIYPEAMVREAIQKIGGFCFGRLDQQEPAEVSLVSGAAFIAKDIRVSGTEVVANIEILNTKEGMALAKALEAGLCVEWTTAGHGFVDDAGVVHDYELVEAVAFMPTPAAP